MKLYVNIDERIKLIQMNSEKDETYTMAMPCHRRRHLNKNVRGILSSLMNK